MESTKNSSCVGANPSADRRDEHQTVVLHVPVGVSVFGEALRELPALRGAAESHDADEDAPLHAADERFLKVNGASRGDGRRLLHALQLLPCASDLARDASDGGRNRGSCLDDPRAASGVESSAEKTGRRATHVTPTLLRRVGTHARDSGDSLAHRQPEASAARHSPWLGLQ